MKTSTTGKGFGKSSLPFSKFKDGDDIVLRIPCIFNIQECVGGFELLNQSNRDVIKNNVMSLVNNLGNIWSVGGGKIFTGFRSYKNEKFLVICFSEHEEFNLSVEDFVVKTIPYIHKMIHKDFPQSRCYYPSLHPMDAGGFEENTDITFPLDYDQLSKFRLLAIQDLNL